MAKIIRESNYQFRVVMIPPIPWSLSLSLCLPLSLSLKNLQENAVLGKGKGWEKLYLPHELNHLIWNSNWNLKHVSGIKRTLKLWYQIYDIYRVHWICKIHQTKFLSLGSSGRVGFLQFPALVIVDDTGPCVPTGNGERFGVLRCRTSLVVLAPCTCLAVTSPQPCWGGGGWWCWKRRRRRRQWLVLTVWRFRLASSSVSKMPRAWQWSEELLGWLEFDELGEGDYHSHRRDHRNRELRHHKAKIN